MLATIHTLSICFGLLIEARGNLTQTDTTTIVFISEIVLMLIVGRLLGEVMRRFHQPEVLGQLVAGILLGPTVLGNVWPGFHQFVFPETPELKKMIDAVSQLGILMLLLLAGMETDFRVVRRSKRTAIFASLSGIILPFACGFVLGELLPDTLLPAPDKRMVTALFLATALSISSIKIVAMVIMEVGFMRRNIGQLILASAIIDDTIGWIIVAVISGIAAEGAINVKGVGFAIGGTVIFLALSLTFGRTLITYVIRWTNDTLQIEFSVLSVILIVMCALAILTDLIGVHTVLGAFVAGILVGQSPIMTDHIREQLRGLVVGLFAPVFFAVAGLSVNLSILKDPTKLTLAIVLILIASLGKLLGCFSGGKLGGLTTRESIALAVGMNARGTTEVIIATIGLSVGVLTQDFYTLIVVMAVATTIIMPPTLRWALTRIPPTGAEKERLAREAAEANDFVPKVERLLIAANGGGAGKLAATLGGLFVGTRKILATVLDLEPDEKLLDGPSEGRVKDWVKASVEAAINSESKRKKGKDEDSAPPPAQLNSISSDAEPEVAILNELKNGYDMVFVGLEDVLSGSGKRPPAFSGSIAQIVREFKGALAIAVARNEFELTPDGQPMKILVPTTGTDYSRRAAEVAVAIAKGAKCSVTALNISPPPNAALFARGEQRRLRPGRELVKDIKELGVREGVTVKTVVKVRRAPELEILNQVKKGKHTLVVLGANVRPSEGLFFGHSINVLLEKTDCSLLIISS